MKPRNYHPGSFHFLTRRCTRRKFLLQTNQLTDLLFLYALANAARRTHVQIIGFCVMSNHYHIIVYDPHANVTKFTQHLNGFVARSMNAAYRRGENFWATDAMCSVELVNRQDVVEKLAYTLANPVAAGLVGRASAWFGITSWKTMLDDVAIDLVRPKVFYSKRAPAKAAVQLEIPASLGPRQKFIDDVIAEVKKIEKHCDAERRANNTTVLGREGVMKQKREDSPTTRHEMFGLRPKVACRSQWARIATLQRNKTFEKLHAEARQRMLAGQVANFPMGTVAMRALVGPKPAPVGPPLVEVFARPTPAHADLMC
jgi:putative transposase